MKKQRSATEGKTNLLPTEEFSEPSELSEFSEKMR